jgi:membrane protein DedA with SNARE-associated domain
MLAFYRRHRTIRVLCAVALVPVWVMVAFVAINSFGNYSHVGDELGVAAIALFAAWAWWWSDRRDRKTAEDTRSGDYGG